MAKNNKSTAAADDAHKPLYNKIDCSGFKSLSNLMGAPKKENKRHSSASVSSLNGLSLHAMYTMTFPL